MDSPGAFVTECVSRGLLAWPCVLSDRPPVLGWISPGESAMPHMMRLGYIVKRAQLLKIKAQVSSLWAKRCMLIECVLSDLT